MQGFSQFGRGESLDLRRSLIPLLDTTLFLHSQVAPPPLTVALSGSSGPQRVGESYTLTCTATAGGIITPTYQWRRGGTLLTAQTSATFSFSEATRTSQTLTFSPLREADTGVYTCTVMRDSLTETSTTVSINVEGEALCSSVAVAYGKFIQYTGIPSIHVHVL